MANKTARDVLRSKLLGGGHGPKKELITLFGEEIELHQPTLGAILSAQSFNDIKAQSINMIIEYAYVPGTDERVFEAGDADVIANWPFGDDLVKLQTTIAKLTGVDTSKEEEKLAEDPLEESSPPTASS